jgi:hypothetical protein
MFIASEFSLGVIELEATIPQHPFTLSGFGVI